ncbi:MAG: sigma-70 family RNA polymerase sigma factor [Odoribacter sp.]|nr:sigma-70 family RNA polymerase sigma factor [Odoribacter sp.]
MNTAQEKEILEAVSKGDQDAFHRLFDIWYKPMCVYAMNYIDSFDDAEDIVQNILAMFWMKYSKERFEGSLKSYLFAAVQYDCVRCLKRQRRHLNVDALPEEGEGEAFVVPEAEEEERYGEEDYRRLMEEIEKLPEQARRIFTLVVLEDRKYKEVAAMLGISVNTVKTSLSRSFKRLRGSLGLIVTILLH